LPGTGFSAKASICAVGDNFGVSFIFPASRRRGSSLQLSAPRDQPDRIPGLSFLLKIHHSAVLCVNYFTLEKLFGAAEGEIQAPRERCAHRA
jgi:hypothetical protein